MLGQGQLAPEPLGIPFNGEAVVLVFFQTDCPTCRLIIPYLNALASHSVHIIGISQDNDATTNEFIEQMAVSFPIFGDRELWLSRTYDLVSVPTLVLVGRDGLIQRVEEGFDKQCLNSIAAALGRDALATDHDGAPSRKPGCMSRHREPITDLPRGSADGLQRAHGSKASEIVLPDGEDEFEYCRLVFGDPLPVIPPTQERVERMLGQAGLEARQVIAKIPPCYGEATVEKIAANAVMAGCAPSMMQVLIPLVRAISDERFNLHGIQATTHFAAPMVIINGPVRQRLGFASSQNVFSNIARANSTLGRALQLIMTNLGGARPDGIDMSTLGNPGKFSYCIAENEEASPWEPLHIKFGFPASASALTLFAAEPPRGVSEHNARTAKGILTAISRVLATVWTYRACLVSEAVVILAPEHAQTIGREGLTKQDVQHLLFENTGIPIREYEDDGGEGTQNAATYSEISINGERCYQKFSSPEAITIVVAGGSAGRFSAVIGSWVAGPRGSQIVSYPI